MTTFKEILKWVLFISGVGLLGYLCFMFFIFMFFSVTVNTFHTKQELIVNYSKHQTQIIELKRYFNSIVPKNKQVEIEFEGDRRLTRFGVSTIDTATGQRVYPEFLDWDLSTNSGKVDSVIKSIGWIQQTLVDLKQKLDKANCIQIENGEPTTIGWQRSGMGMYFYKVFDLPIVDSLKMLYNDSCSYILYSNKVVLEYQGGAIGSQCFPKN